MFYNNETLNNLYIEFDDSISLLIQLTKMKIYILKKYLKILIKKSVIK